MTAPQSQPETASVTPSPVAADTRWNIPKSDPVRDAPT